MKKKFARLEDFQAAAKKSTELDLGPDIGCVYILPPLTNDGLKFSGISGDEANKLMVELVYKLTVDDTGEQIFKSPEDVNNMPATLFVKIAGIIGDEAFKKDAPENPLGEMKT